jgi:hypothetical protein
LRIFRRCWQRDLSRANGEYAEILFLLVGRGGSKGLPGKNLREIGGLSLIGYKARSALQSRYLFPADRFKR